MNTYEGFHLPRVKKLIDFRLIKNILFFIARYKVVTQVIITAE